MTEAEDKTSASAASPQPLGTKVIVQGIAAAVGTVATLFSLLFVSAGTWNWWPGWAHFALWTLYMAVGTPLLLKIAPDLDWPQIDEILELVTAHGLAGLIATNTTLDHSCVPPEHDETGGLSGKPLRARSTEIVRYICKHIDLPVIAAGGIFDAESAQEKLDAGAALVQLYTGFIYRGPALIGEICRAL